MRSRLTAIAQQTVDADVRGIGMLQGIAWPSDPGLAKRVSHRAFRAGVVAEMCGARDEVLKIMPPLTITETALTEALARIDEAVAMELSGRRLELAG